MEKDTAIGDYNRDSRVKVLCSWLVDLAGHRLVCDTEEILNALFDKERDILGRQSGEELHFAIVPENSI
jgi:hypothetical protein